MPPAAATTSGTWGVLPEETYDISDTVSLWMGNHSMKTGASFTYDVTEQLYQPLQNGVYRFTGVPGRGARTRSSFSSRSRWFPRPR